VYWEATAQMTQAPEVGWQKEKTKTISVCPKVAKANPKYHLRKDHPTIRLLAGQTTTPLQNTNVTFQSNAVLCTASISIIQAFQKYNTKLSSTCVDCNPFPSTWSQEKELLLCCKTVSSPESSP
jgi:hypothetical protein